MAIRDAVAAGRLIRLDGRGLSDLALRRRAIQSYGRRFGPLLVLDPDGVLALDPVPAERDVGEAEPFRLLAGPAPSFHGGAERVGPARTVTRSAVVFIPDWAPGVRAFVVGVRDGLEIGPA
jgi:hypothetical protein